MVKGAKQTEVSARGLPGRSAPLLGRGDPARRRQHRYRRDDLDAVRPAPRGKSLAGLPSPIVAAAAMSLSSVSVIANALRLRRAELS